MQVANVAFGGSLHQHLADVEVPSQVAHGPHGFPSPLEGVEHPIEIAPGSLLTKALNGYDVPPAISYHHQAVDRLGSGFTATAWAADSGAASVAAAKTTRRGTCAAATKMFNAISMRNRRVSAIASHFTRSMPVLP